MEERISVFYVHVDCFLQSSQKTYVWHLNLKPQEYCSLCLGGIVEDSPHVPVLVYGEVSTTGRRWKRNIRPYAILINSLLYDITLFSEDEDRSVVIPTASQYLYFGFVPTETFETIGKIVVPVVRQVSTGPVSLPPEIEDVWWIMDESLAQPIWRWYRRVDILAPAFPLINDEGGIDGYRALLANPYTVRDERESTEETAPTSSG
jgi:hypothetical protein